MDCRVGPVRAGNSGGSRPGASNSQRPLHALHPVALDDVADLHVVIILEGHAAFLAGHDLARVVLEPLELRQLALMDHNVVANEPDVGAALDDAVGDAAAGDVADLRDLEDFEDRGVAEHGLAQRRRKQAGHRLLHVVDQVVDDRVVADFDAVALANASNAVVVGFNVRANGQARAAAERDGIEIRYYSIIYDLVDDVKKAMSGLLAPTLKENFLGNATILDVFNISKVGKVAGCRVTEGKVERGAKVRLIRDNVVVHEGTLSTLKRFKDEVREVPTGQECGMAFVGYQDMRKGDVIECFNIETVIRSL